jgi:predicted phage tail protein
VDTTGNVGAFYPATTAAGVHGQSTADASAILLYLTAQISQTQLAQDVLSPIQAIPGIQSTLTATQTSITNETTARVAADSAMANQITQLQAQYSPSPLAGDPAGFAGNPTAFAGVYSEMTARAEADLALSQKTDTVSAAITTASSNMTAAINAETQARVDADSATASQITTVQASVTTVQSNLDGVNNTLTAAVQTNANAYADLNGRVAASYTIKTQITSNGRTYIAGIGVGVDNSSGTVESQVLVAASRFAILDPNGTAVSSPFVVQGGQVFMSSAFIADASITNAKISGNIQSNAVGANGQPRWVLNRDGTLQLNGANGGSGYLLMNDSQLLVYDGNNTLRVRLGLW